MQLRETPATKLIIRTKCPLIETDTVGKDEIVRFKFPKPLKDVIASPTNILYLTDGDNLYISGHVFDPTSRGKVSLFPSNVIEQSKLEDVITTPQKIEGVPNSIEKISMGSYFCMVLSKGKLYSWGAYEGGQLGIQEVFNPCKPELVPQLNDIKDVSCGGYHTLALNIWGEVFSWGKNDFGQLGRNNTSKREIPSLIPTLRNVVVTKIYSGAFCSACVTEEGMGYIWGKHLKMKEPKRIPTQLNLKGCCKTTPFIISIELAFDDIYVTLHDGRIYRFIDFNQFEELTMLSAIGVTRAVGGTDRMIVECDSSDVYQILPRVDNTTLNIFMKNSEFEKDSHIRRIGTSNSSTFILYEQNPQYTAAKNIVLFLRKFLRQIEGIISIYADPLANFVQQLDCHFTPKTPRTPSRRTQPKPPQNSQLQRCSSLNNLKEEDKYFVSNEDVQKIFYGIKPLSYSLPSILNDFSRKLNSWNPESTLNDIVSSFLQLNITRQFINISNNIAESLTTLQMIKNKSVEVQQFLIHQEKSFTQFDFDFVFEKRNDLPSLLLLPIKFLPQFYTLLKRYHETLYKNHLDVGSSELIFTQFDKLLSRINDSFHLDNIFDISKCFPDENGSISITSGTVTDLINRLYNMNLNDPEYTDMFLMTHKKFTDSETILNQLLDMYSNSKTTQESKSCILSVLSQWIRNYVSDFEKKTDFIGKLKSLVSKESHSERTNLLALSLNSVGISLAMRSRARVYLPIQTNLKVPYQYFMSENNVIAFAQILNSFNSVIFSRLSYEELIVMNFGKAENKPITPNIQNMTERFNWIGDVIVGCFNECPKNDKQKFIDGLILFMKTLQQLKDIHFLVAVSYTLPRLDLEFIRTKKLSIEDQNYLNETEELCTFKNNYKALRQYLSQMETPYIPFIGVLSKDLMLIDEGNPDQLSDGTINLYKWRKVYELIQQFLDARPTNLDIKSSNEEIQILVQKIYSFK